MFLLFETSSDKYAWLNAAVAYGRAARAATGIALDVFRVSSSQGPSEPVDPLRRGRSRGGHADDL